MKREKSIQYFGVFEFLSIICVVKHLNISHGFICTHNIVIDTAIFVLFHWNNLGCSYKFISCWIANNIMT